MHKFSPYMYVCALHVCMCPTWHRHRLLLELEVTDSLELPCMLWELSPGPPQDLYEDLYVLLTNELSLWSLIYYLKSYFP